MENQGSLIYSDEELELSNDRRMTRVLKPNEVQYPNSDDDLKENAHPRRHSPRPAQSMCVALEGMTSEQVQELLHKMNINDDSSEDEAFSLEKEKIAEEADGKSQIKATNKKAPAKKVAKGNHKSGKRDVPDQNADQVELTAPPQEVSVPDETKAKKTKRGKKDVAAPDNVSIITSDMTSKDAKKDIDEDIVIKRKKKVTKGKQNSAIEISNEGKSLELVPKEKNNLHNEENEQESESKTKKNTKKTKQTENSHNKEQKEDGKKQNVKVLANNDEKEKPGKPLKKGKDEVSVVKELVSEEKNNGENKAVRPVRGKQKNTTEILMENEPKEKASDRKTEEEPNKGRAKRNTKKETQEVAEDVAEDVDPEVVKEVQKPKKKVNIKQKENPDKNLPKSKPTSKTNQPKEEKLPANNNEGKEEVPAPKRATRKTVK